MTSIYDETGRAWELGARIGGGGEGEVFRLRGADNHCAKIYAKRPLPSAHEEKLLAIRSLLPQLQSVAAIPLGLLYAKPGRRDPLGVVLPFVDGLDVHEIYNPEARLEHLPNANPRFLIAAARNIAFVFRQLHAHGVVVGDISEQNLRVREDATVRLIDCDSVQLSASGRIFPCGVGSVMWTPPELQGKNLSGILRTENHDRFGLAQLIFLLLFSGRYPFCGTPEPGVNLDPGEAIARHAFAYDPNPPARLLRPPPNALPFNAYPGQIQTLFLRAFRTGSETPGARPDPKEWIDALDELDAHLVPCRQSRTHSHWSGLRNCPWCELAGRSGADLFPDQDGSFTGATISGLGLWDSKAFVLDPIELQPVPEPAVQQAIDHAQLRRKVTWIPLALQKIEVLRKLLSQWGSSEIQAQFAAAESQVHSLEQRVSGLHGRYSQNLKILQARAEGIAKMLLNPGILSAELRKSVEQEVRQEALESYLEEFPVTDIELRGLGQRKRDVLLDNGIETLADLRAENLRGLPLLGPTMIARLIKVRHEAEAQFHFIRNNRVEQTISSRVALLAKKGTPDLKAQIKALQTEALKLKGEYAREIGQQQAVYHDLVLRQEVLRAQL